VDFKVAEEGVCAEDGEDFVDDVVGWVVRGDGEWGVGGLERWEGLSWAAGAGAQGQGGEVAWFWGFVLE